MKKLFGIFLTALLAVSVNAATFTFDEGLTYQEADGVLLELAKGTGSSEPYFATFNGNEMRLYAQNTITIVATEITSVQIVFAKSSANNKPYASLSANCGNLVDDGESTSNSDRRIDTWTGSTDEVIFTLGETGQRAIYKVVVNGDPITLDDPDEPESYIDTMSLDPAFPYSEPTAIITPEKNFYKQQYAFVQSNIRVSCTQGSILNNDSVVYFNCNAGYAMTFEAAKPIKGIVINGAVRKLFSATTDKGVLEFLSPDALYEDDYQECEHALIVKDVNAETVTISCEKQIRCYSVYVYFDANPTDSIDCDEQSGGETYFVTYNAADAVYESEISEDEGMPNYTIFLYNEGEDYPYIGLDLYPGTTGDLTGVYSMDDGSLGDYTYYQYGPDGMMDFYWVTEGDLVINKEGNIYTISGYITCDNGDTYNFSFTGEMPLYTDTEYYEAEGISGVSSETQASKVLQNGQIVIVNKDKVFTVTGAVIR